MGWLGMLRPRQADAPVQDAAHAVLFSAAFAGLGVDLSLLVSWAQRADEIDATPMEAGNGRRLLQDLWSRDRHMRQLDADAIASLARYFDFATVPAGQDIIRQDEHGDFMVVLLSGAIAVDRLQPWGERLRLAEIRPGEVLGEMSLLDSARRFSTCTTMDACGLAVLDAARMDDMMTAAPRLAASLIALLARRLSLRLRAVGARLSDRN